MLHMISALPPMLALFMAIVCEVVATTMLPKTQQFTQLVPTLIVLTGYGAAFFLLSVTVKVVPIGVAYAIWCGAGIVLVALISWLWYGQKLDLYALLGIAFIMAGTLIINVFSKSLAH